MFSLKNALNDFSADEDEESDGLLKPRVKTTEERKAEEDEYYDWLKGHRQDVANVDEDLVSSLLSCFNIILLTFHICLEKPEKELGHTKVRRWRAFSS
jgi:hypothetical protein